MKWDVIIALSIALYGAALSTFNLMQQRKDRRVQVTVELNAAMLAPGGDTVVMLTASNSGHKRVQLNLPGFYLPTKRNLIIPRPFGTASFPHFLEPEATCSVWVYPAELDAMLSDSGFKGTVKLVGYFKDSVGRVHKSKGLDYDIEGWLS